MPNGETAFIERLKNLLDRPPEMPVWIGDDAAVLNGGLLFTCDVLVEGVHFDLAWCTAEDVGWKAIAVNASDIAAMGGSPTYCLAAIVVPDRAGQADQVARGIAAASRRLHCSVAGGDTSSGSTLVVSIAMLGRAPDSPVTRGGARPGDWIYVTGDLGGPANARQRLARGEAPESESLARLRRPVPRLAAGVAAHAAGAGAMIDISDGLAKDLARLCEASQVAATIDALRIPSAPAATVDDALYGGDDYELIFCAPSPNRVYEVFAQAGLTAPTPIGRIEYGQGAHVLRQGRRERLRGGWEHAIR